MEEEKRTMRAAVFDRQGADPELLYVKEDMKKPMRDDLRKGELLIKVAFAGVNPVDFKQRQGEIPWFVMQPRPWIVGLECSGVVVAANIQKHDGDDNTTHTFAIGDRVATCVWPFLRSNGCCAEYVRVDANLCALLWRGEGEADESNDREEKMKKQRVSLEEAAAVPLCGLTAWQALEGLSHLGDGARILIHAGAGGVGLMAIQIAKYRKYHVTTTCSAGNVNFLTNEVGADCVIDYTAAPFERQLAEGAPFDAVIDVIGGDYEHRSKTLLSCGGKYVHVINSGYVHLYKGNTIFAEAARTSAIIASFAKAFIRLGPWYSIVTVTPNGEQLRALFALIAEGRVRVFVNSVLPLSDVRDAHAMMETRHTRGKIVLRL